MVVQSLRILPAWPSSTARKSLTPYQNSSLVLTVSNALSNVLSTSQQLKPDYKSTRKTASKVSESLASSTLTFLRSYLLDQAFQRLQTTIWGVEEDTKTPEERAIHAKVLQLSETLAEQGGIDELKILTDLAIVYARASPSKVQRVFSKCASNSPKLVSQVSEDLVPSITTILQSTQGLYGQRKVAEVIYTFMVASTSISKHGDTSEALFLSPFLKNTSFLVALSNLYLPGLASTAISYGGEPALISAISTSAKGNLDADPTEWTTIWINAKLALIDAFHLLFKQLLATLTQSKTPHQRAEHTEMAFTAVFALLEGPAQANTSTGGLQPTPFLNLTLLQDYQRSHDLTRLFTRALNKAEERDARLDLIESSLAIHGSSGEKDPGALTLLLRGSGLPRRTAAPRADIKGKGPATDAPQSSYSIPHDPTIDFMSKTSQILDLLPDYSPEYLGKLLRHPSYNGDVERVIGALLDGSAPDEGTLDPPTEFIENVVPERRNVFNTEVVDFGSVRYGKKQGDAETLLAKPDQSMREKMKANILQRVEIMDMESDEEEEEDPFALDDSGKLKAKPKIVAFEDDDDIEGVVRVPGAEEEDEFEGHTESEAENTGEAKGGLRPESIIEAAYVTDPSVFARDASTRRSKARAELKANTGWDQEQIEGWASMLERNPKRKEKLLMKHEFKGNVISQAPAQDPGTDGPSSSGHQSDGFGRGHHPGRGRGGGRGSGRGGRGEGGHQAEGSGGSRGNARGRAWKDKNKASRANHDRKRGHDKKMARGGGPS